MAEEKGSGRPQPPEPGNRTGITPNPLAISILSPFWGGLQGEGGSIVSVALLLALSLQAEPYAMV
jgi:hypothetical protein